MTSARHALSLALGLAFAATTARADFPETVRDHILPGYAALAETTATLAAKTAETCEPAQVQPLFHAAFDAWMGVQHLHFGPVETDGRALAIQYWPDPKASGAKAQTALLQGDPARLSPDAFAEQSVAARGLMALERLLYPAEPLTADICPLLRATAADLAHTAATVNDEWTGGFAETVTTAGEAGNTTFLNSQEVRQVLFTQIASGLEFIADSRLERPLGTFDAPHPERAEARASGRSQRNVLLSLQAMRAMTASLTTDAPQTLAAFDTAIKLAGALDDPSFDGIATPSGHLKVEILDQAVDRILELVGSELGPAMKVGIGFNAGDGD